MYQRVEADAFSLKQFSNVDGVLCLISLLDFLTVVGKSLRFSYSGLIISVEDAYHPRSSKSGAHPYIPFYHQCVIEPGN